MKQTEHYDKALPILIPSFYNATPSMAFQLKKKVDTKFIIWQLTNESMPQDK